MAVRGSGPQLSSFSGVSYSPEVLRARQELFPELMNQLRQYWASAQEPLGQFGKAFSQIKQAIPLARFPDVPLATPFGTEAVGRKLQDALSRIGQRTETQKLQAQQAFSPGMFGPASGALQAELANISARSAQEMAEAETDIPVQYAEANQEAMARLLALAISRAEAANEARLRRGQLATILLQQQIPRESALLGALEPFLRGDPYQQSYQPSKPGARVGGVPSGGTTQSSIFPWYTYYG